LPGSIFGRLVDFPTADRGLRSGPGKVWRIVIWLLSSASLANLVLGWFTRWVFLAARALRANSRLIILGIWMESVVGSIGVCPTELCTAGFAFMATVTEILFHFLVSVMGSMGGWRFLS
jgi:hypothetical protein